VRALLHSTPGSAARLEGRVAELAALSSLVRGLSLSGGALVLVGDPGSGKTALLHAAHGLARDAGVLVLAASAAEFELEIPFSGLSQIVLPLRTTLDELGPPHREALDVALGLRDGRPPALADVASAALALLREASRSRGVLLLVDDLPWLDRVSAAVFSSIARRVSSLPVGLVATVRTGASTAFDRSGLVEYELRPLDEDACVRLLRSRFAELPRVELTRLVSESRGNPLALLELPRASSGLAGLSRTPVTTSSASVSRRVELLFAGRVDALPPQTRRLLLLTACRAAAICARWLRLPAVTSWTTSPSPRGWTWCPWTTSCRMCTSAIPWLPPRCWRCPRLRSAAQPIERSLTSRRAMSSDVPCTWPVPASVRTRTWRTPSRRRPAGACSEVTRTAPCGCWSAPPSSALRHGSGAGACPRPRTWAPT
jgi:energy-coupling factor transporter ATP-binding protein EcfA2